MSKYVIRSYTQPGGKGMPSLNKDCKFVDYGRNIAIIADGVNSANGGMQAANEAVHWAAMQLGFVKDKLDAGKLGSEEIGEMVQKTLLFANNVILTIGKGIESYKGWSTTLDCCLIHNDTAYIGHVGDSRVYYLGRKRLSLEQLTKDHSSPKRDANELSGKVKTVAEMSSVLNNYFGKEDMTVDMITKPIEVSDSLLMVTDGVTKILSDRTLYRLLREYSLSRRLKNVLVRRLNNASQYARDLAKLENMSYEDACKELVDDKTFIAIKRVK